MTVIEEVNAKIKELLDYKFAQEKELSDLRKKALAEEKKAESEVNEAAKHLDRASYAKAATKLKEAKTTAEMCNIRSAQLKDQDYISEAESDEYIKKILDYEAELEREFKLKAASILKGIEILCADYDTKVMEAEKALHTWEYRIHKNFRSTPGNINSERRDKPKPVRSVQYSGFDGYPHIRNTIKELVKKLTA